MSLADTKVADLLRHREVIQIAIGVYQVIFCFDKDVEVSVEGHFNYVHNSVAVDWYPQAIQVAAMTVELLGSNVLDVQKVDDDGLRLSFSNGDLLTITRPNQNFESYQVTGTGVGIIV
jgi:hypothetical protein